MMCNVGFVVWVNEREKGNLPSCMSCVEMKLLLYVKPEPKFPICHFLFEKVEVYLVTVDAKINVNLKYQTLFNLVLVLKTLFFYL